ncbi:MAG TPA: amino acid adenylation domain-containing protein [Kofleriaceae bacterium]|nr:amino acid adenylation domain-containing protein [Kofleriaceae bacterium]
MDLKQRIAQLSPAQLALLEQKLKKKPRAQPGAQPVPAERRQYAPLSFSQERLWFLEQLEPGSSLYNLPLVLPLRGPMDPALVEASVRQIVARHGALRTRFVVRDGDPYQVMTDDPAEALDFGTIDLRTADQRPQAVRLAQTIAQTINDTLWMPFDLATGPLVRVRLILQRDHESVLVVVMHHIISDGWSLNVFVKELRALYEAARTGGAANLPSPPQYIDYSIAQRESLQGEQLASLLGYWRARLEGAPSLLSLPLDRPRPARQSFKGALYPFEVSRSSLQHLSALCRESGVVPFMVLLSAFKVLLFRYTHQSKIVVGTPIANRSRSDLEAVIGFFTNTLVLCSSMTPEMSFRSLLAQVRDTTLGAYAHQELPFEKLVSELQPERSLAYNPLFQVMFTFQNLPVERTSDRDVAPPGERPLDAASLDFKFSKFDLTLAMTETDAGVSAVFEYATDLFEAATIERMAGHLVNILEHVLAHPDAPLAAFSFLTERERALILEQWNDTRRAWPEILPLHARFERRARETPDAPAVMFRDTTLTYRQLDRRANAIARVLRSRGVDRGSIVGICLHRSVEMVAGLFGILKAGAAYLPIEPDFPAARTGYMLRDAKVSQVLTTSECRSVLSAHGVDAIALDELAREAAGAADDAPAAGLGPADLAYVLFTSGSTGQPKGVMISHGAIDNRLQWMQAEYELTPADRVMQKTPYTFDVSVWEFFWPLSVGACLVVAEPERHKESVYLVELIKRARVTCLHFVPSMLQLFLHEPLADCDSLTRIFCSGEALSIEQCRRLQALPDVRAHNLYGPTEAAVDVTHWDCSQWRDQYLSVPIGRPIANTQIYILNEQLQPAPIGVPGELYIGGHNLAEGYLNKPELTAKQFIASPFASDASARLYKTGDLARFRADGNIEYIARIDSQIKLRGLRIELGEIESVLGQYPGIAEAAVVVHRFGDLDERLAAYVVPDAAASAIDTGAVGAALAKQLPSYMVPSTITILPELPLTPNGKLDRKRLPEPTLSRAAERMEPVGDIEATLLGIWRKVLRLDAVSTTDDFFALGGHSILVTQVINAINGHYHLDVPVRLLFENPTVKTLAKALSEHENEAWLNDSKLAKAMLTRSSRHLLQNLDRMSEEQIDELLKQHLEDPQMARFEEVPSLLAWARDYKAPEEARPRSGPGPGASTSTPASASAAGAGPGAGSPLAAYPRFYPELVQARAIMQDQVGRIFERYVLEVRQRWSETASTALPPADLRELCGQLMTMASLAASLKPY